METPAHNGAAAVDAYVAASIPAASTAAVNSATVAPSAELDYAAQRQDVAIDPLPSDALCVSPPTMAQVPLPRLEDGVETAAPSAGTPLPSLSATTTTSAVARESSHPHLHLLHIIQQQQERIAVLQTSLAHASRSAQRSSEALESLQGKQRVPACTGRIRPVGVASSPVGRASAPLPSTAEMASAVANTVRWADSVAVTAMPTSPVSCGSFTEWKDDVPQVVCCSHTPSSPSTSPATFSPLPVILLDITSMFTTRSTRAAAAQPEAQQSSPSTHRRSSETQTYSVATEAATPTDDDIAGSSDAARQLVDRLRGELAGARRRLQAAGTSVLSYRSSILALEQSSAPGASSREPADAVSCNGGPGASHRLDSVPGVDGASCEGAATECIGHDDTRKDMEELQRLRLLLRFSELKKDSDRLAEVEGALRESSAAQLRLRQRCNSLEHENSQRGDCLRAIASCVETTLAASSNGTFGHRRDDSTATATPPIELSDSLVSLLRYVLHLCTDAALTPGAHKEPLPLPYPSLPKARQSSVQSRQDRLHKAVSDSRDGRRSLPLRPPSRMASWHGSGAAAAAGLGERRASKH
ncbi:conserved hypothetical protein [Leishmania mexicana MHOM/GT/2001/U1103]|uniref:Uncharacterized protein n=1 Tax=Leishmania mexicana (strain MHOM/GT/2001/U1103) TaxID=929439 RepID=E9AQ16_LEIMU|nr:conserved hypothetical protein [Leishmania mexicana MHOM/GT/2001/U1103]CBZ25034.1 conserved hypothetical protein [Leishmania mexicana MHOM/GT/2001/U1103]